jgi:tripartite-type tricarboxylate transporter receptor subunit TctC
VLPHVKAGKVRALGVTSAQRTPFLPELPTIAESGYPGFEAVGWFGFLAPAQIPKDVLTKLNSETVRILNAPEVNTKIAALGAQVRPTTPAEFDAFNREQIQKWGKVIKESGAKAD